MLFTIFEIVGIAWVLWVVFVLALVSQLKEISKSTWHYKLYNLCATTRCSLPKNLCLYRGILMASPAILFFICIALIVIGCVMLIRFVSNWVFIPFFLGKIPDKSFKEVCEDIWDFASYIPTKKFVTIPPIVWVGVASLSLGIFYELRRLMTQTATAAEYKISAAVFVVILLALILIQQSTRASIKSIWSYAKEKFCRVVPVVD